MIKLLEHEKRKINKTIRFNEKELEELESLKEALGCKTISEAVRYAVHKQLKEVQNNE